MTNQAELTAAADRVLQDQRLYRAGMDLIKTYRPSREIPPGAEAQDLDKCYLEHSQGYQAWMRDYLEANPQTDDERAAVVAAYERYRPFQAPRLYVNLVALHRAEFFLKTLAWVRVVEESRMMFVASGPLPRNAWQSSGWLTLAMRTVEVTPSPVPEQPWCHRVKIYHLKTADLLSYPRPAPRASEIWSDVLAYRSAGVFGGGQGPVYLSGVPTLSLDAVVRGVLSNHVKLGRQYRVPWEEA